VLGYLGILGYASVLLNEIFNILKTQYRTWLLQRKTPERKNSDAQISRLGNN
jgi:hypothetical protein